MTRINIELDLDTERKLEKITKDCNLTIEKVCEILLMEFARLEGGFIYEGTWEEGNGSRFVIQWPFIAGLVKKTGEELKKGRVK